MVSRADVNHNFTDAELDELRAFGAVESHKAGDLLVEEGAMAPDCIVTLSGQTDIFASTDEGRIRVGWMERGQFAGDLSVLTGQRHLSRVEMGDPAVPQGAQQLGRRIRLDRIHGRAGKPVDEETRRARRGVRTDKRDRFDRRKCLNQPVGAMMLVQLKGPPKITLDLQGCLAVIGSPPGAAERDICRGVPPVKTLSRNFVTQR